MCAGIDREQLEDRLRQELEAAERLLNEATPEQRPEALRRFENILGKFSDLVLEGKVPLEPQ